MNELFKNNQIRFEDESLYTTKAVAMMLPRALFCLVRTKCRANSEKPIKGVLYGKAINQALEEIFMNNFMNEDVSAAPKALEVGSRANNSKQKGKRNGRNVKGNGGNRWFGKG